MKLKTLELHHPPFGFGDRKVLTTKAANPGEGYCTVLEAGPRFVTVEYQDPRKGTLKALVPYDGMVRSAIPE